MSILVPEGSEKSVPKVVGARAVGERVMVEMLTPQELMNSSLFVGDNTKTGLSPQGYVVDIGPGLREKVELKVGDRVVLQGTYVPLPKVGGSHRDLGVVEYFNIKAVLVEE